LLAAGASARLGKPKQLLLYKGKSLLQHATQAALDSRATPVVIVTGANAELVQKEMTGPEVIYTENKEWAEGMASSVRCGLNILLGVAPATDSVIMMVCDQPYVNPKLLNDLLATQWKTGQPIVTSQYENVSGPPALFHKIIFPELLALKGDAGARKIIQRHAHEMATVSFPQGKIDIDTEEDYEALQQS
jgi:molybdenum cofactor cytidylyltransferase